MATLFTPMSLPRSTGALVALCLSMLLSSLGTSIANVALPTLVQAFDTTFSTVQWVVLAYLLVITTLIVSLGRLGDRVGRRRLLLAGIALFSAASAGCGMAPSVGWLVAARATQGAGAAVMMALTLALVGDTVPRARAGRTMGLLGTMSAVGTACGPSLGGLLIAVADWRAIFLVQVPLGLVTWRWVSRHLPLDPAVAAGRPVGFDPAGSLLLVVTLGAYALATTTGQGRFGSVNGVLLAAAAVGAGLFVAVERRVASPLLPLDLLSDRPLAAGLAASAAIATVMMATLVVGPFHLAHTFGLGTAQVGAALSLGPLTAALAGVPAGRLVDRFGTARVLQIGLAVMGGGAMALSVVPERLGIAGYLLPLVVLTAGYALAQTANNTAVMAALVSEQRGVVSGLLNVSRHLGFITGAAVLGAVFTLGTGSADPATAAPSAVAAGLRVTFGAAALLVVATLLGRRALR